MKMALLCTKIFGAVLFFRESAHTVCIPQKNNTIFELIVLIYPPTQEVITMKIAPLATLYFICLLGMLPVAASAVSAPPADPAAPSPYLISADGLEVTDPKTGLIWRRCAEGMSWKKKTCTGTALAFTHQQALSRASTEAVATGVAWRLPNDKELPSIADKTRKDPAIDAVAFPATPSSFFWASSPYITIPQTELRAWHVDFLNGFSFGGFQTNSSHVRLVRAGK